MVLKVSKDVQVHKARKVYRAHKVFKVTPGMLDLKVYKVFREHKEL